MTKTLNTCILIISMLMLSFCLQACSSGDTVFTVNFTIGEHGTVNDKTGEYTEEIDIEEGYPLIIAADEGYMLDEICVAGDQKESEDFTAIAQDNPYNVEGKLYYFFEDFAIAKNTDIEVSFKEIDSPDVLTSAEKVFSISATCEGPGSIITVYDNDEGFYLPTDEKEDRTIEWFADSDQNGIVKSVIINGEEDKSFAGKEDGSYTATSGDVSVHVIFEESNIPTTEPDEIEYHVKTTAGKGGDITDSFTYTEDEDTEEEVIIYADTGYFIESVTINGKAQTVSDRVGIGEQQGVYTFRKGDQTIEATFTNEATANTKAGKVTLVPNKTEIRKYDEVDIEISFEPENTNEKSKYVIDISDYGFISSDKGTFSGTSVTGTIDFGKKKEVVHLKVRYSDGTLDGVVTATLYNETFKAVVESDIFLISEEDTSPPPEDEIILDKEDILDEDFDEEEEGHSHIVPISIAGIIIVALLAAVFVIRRKRKK